MPAPTRVFRVLSLVMGGYFLFASAVQMNDPDAAAWAGLYGCAALVTLSAAWRLPPYWVPGLVTAVAMVWAVVWMPSAFESSFPQLFASWTMMSPEMEVGREFLGLILLAVWMAMLTLHAHAQRPRLAA